MFDPLFITYDIMHDRMIKQHNSAQCQQFFFIRTLSLATLFWNGCPVSALILASINYTTNQ